MYNKDMYNIYIITIHSFRLESTREATEKVNLHPSLILISSLSSPPAFIKD